MDIKIARNAGMPVIIVEIGIGLGIANLDEIHSMRPDAIVPSLPDAAKLLYE